MAWKVKTALETMLGRPTDLRPAELADRMKACATCPKRVGETCHSAKQLLTVHALKKQNRCPLGKWSGGPGPQPRDQGTKPAARPGPMAGPVKSEWLEGNFQT